VRYKRTRSGIYIPKRADQKKRTDDVGEPFQASRLLTQLRAESNCNLQISTPGQDTREDGHATADTPGNCNGGVTPQRVWCMATLKLTKPTRAISASGAALVAHDRRAQTSEGIHARPQRHPSLTRHAPVAREARDSCERGHTAATPPRPVSDRFWPLRGRADASARDGPHRAHRQRERRCPDARVAREDRSRSHTPPSPTTTSLEPRSDPMDVGMYIGSDIVCAVCR
jgi:hypothetical protein